MRDDVNALIEYYRKYNSGEFAKMVHRDFGFTYEKADVIYSLIRWQRVDVVESLLKAWQKETHRSFHRDI